MSPPPQQSASVRDFPRPPRVGPTTWRIRAAHHLTPRVAGRVVEGCACGHPDPPAGLRALEDRLAFHPGRLDERRVDDEPAMPRRAGFCGGRVTADPSGPFEGEPGSEGR